MARVRFLDRVNGQEAKRIRQLVMGDLAHRGCF
jgi:hypothetical protein